MEEPSSICLHLPKRRAAFPVGLSITPEKLAPNTHWVGFVCAPRHQHPNARRCWFPQQSRESPLVQAHGKQPVLPGTTEWHAGTPHSWAPAPCKRKAAAGCLAKLCVGSFLATPGISSYCFSSLRLLLQSLAKGSSICCLQVLSFTGHAGEEPAAWKAAVGNRGCQWVLSFLHMVPQQLAQRTQQFQYLLWGRTALSLLQMPMTSHTRALKKQKQCLQGQLRGAHNALGKELGLGRPHSHRVTLFLPHPMKQGRHCRPLAALIPRPSAWKKIWLQLQIRDCFAHRGMKAISIPQGLMRASHSILASALPIAELPKSFPGNLQAAQADWTLSWAQSSYAR